MTRKTKLLGTLACLFVPALAVAELEDLNVFSPGEVISSSQVNDNFDALKTAVEDLQAELATLKARHIETSVEIDVENCSELQGELEALGSKTIAPSAVVTFTIAAGEHECETIQPWHPNGNRLEIRGAGPDPADTVLNFTSHGILLEKGAVLGNLALLTLVGPGAGDATTKSDGVRVLGANINLNDVVIRNFRDGINAFFSTTVLGNRVTAEQNRRNGFYAEDGATLQLGDSLAADNAANGYEATRNGVITLSTPAGASASATASGNESYGFRASYGSLIYGYDPLVEGDSANGQGLALPAFNTFASDGASIRH